jgi:hypothetical protein
LQGQSLKALADASENLLIGRLPAASALAAAGVSSGSFFFRCPEVVMRERAETTLEDPMAPLERALIDEFLKARGCTLSTVGQKPIAEGQVLLKQAAQYAIGRLAEIDARAAYLQQIHGGSEKG